MDLKTFFEHFDTLAEAPNGIQRLRELILDMAVRGKLVPQDPADEPASALINKAQITKKKLAQLGKIRSSKSLDKIPLDIIPYDLPHGWQWVWLDSISDIGTGSTPLKSTTDFYLNGTIPWVTSAATSQNLVTEAETLVTELAVNEHRLRIYPPGSLIVALYGQGKTRGQVTRLGIDATINQACAAITFVEAQETLADYIQFFFEKQYEELRSLAAGGAQPNLNVRKIKETLVPLPPLAEQKRIVAKVDELMALCDTLEAAQQTRNTLRQSLRASALDALMNATSDDELATAWSFVRDNWGTMSDRAEDVEGLRKTALQVALRGKLTSFEPSDQPVKKLLQEALVEKQKLIEKGLVKNRRKELLTYELPWEIPKHWVAVPVDAVAFSFDHLRVPVNKTERSERSGDVPYYGANGQVGWIDEPLFDEPLVLVVEDETFIGRTKPFSYKISGPSWVNNHAHVLRPSSGILPDFLNFALMYYPFAPLTSGTTGRRKLTQPTLLGVEIPVPPVGEQMRIVKRVEDFWELCDQLEESLRQQQQQAEALVASAISHLAA